MLYWLDNRLYYDSRVIIYHHRAFNENATTKRIGTTEGGVWSLCVWLGKLIDTIYKYNLLLFLFVCDKSTMQNLINGSTAPESDTGSFLVTTTLESQYTAKRSICTIKMFERICRLLARWQRPVVDVINKAL